MKVAIIGATGAVGRAFLHCLEKRQFPVDELFLYASSKSDGIVMHFRDEPVRVKPLTLSNINKTDIAFFTAGSTVSRDYACEFVKKGAIVIDNSSAFRLQEEVPLVVPEVNPEDISKHKGIISNPNCATIQLVVVLKPIDDFVGLKRAIVTTLQAVSGAGGRALYEFENEITHKLWNSPFKREIFARQIAFNLIPQIPQKKAFEEDGYTTEEKKIINETRKILKKANLAISATCVRVPVFNAHSESVNIETQKKATVFEITGILKQSPGIVVSNKPEEYPTPAEVSGQEKVFVGRIREDTSVDAGLWLWIVADNLLKGAALNAVQIAELLLKT